MIMSQWILLAVILIEGFVTISAEILTIRQLLPMAGSSVIVTSLIIGVFLLFLAYGYRRGGQYQDKYTEILKRNFVVSSVFFSIGLSYVFIYWYFSLFHQYINSHILWSLTTYLLLVTAPLVYILGQTVPITMNIIRHAPTVGATGGKILHLSTIGSFLGAVITSLLLMNYLGVAWTIVINCALLAFMVIFLFSDRRIDTIRLVFLGVILFIAYRFNVVVQNNVLVAANAYGNYAIYKDESAQNKILVVNESRSSSLNEKKQGFPYIEAVKKILFDDLNLQNKDILVLGAGGFTLSAEDPHQNHFVYVDIDNEIKDIVQQNYLKEIHGDFISDDARNYLKKANKKFDAIISDVYSNARTIPAHLITREYFSLINEVLQDQGVAIINIVGRPMLLDDYSFTVDNTIRSVFKKCMVYPLHYTYEPSNIIYICKKNFELSEKKGAVLSTSPIYTDDKNSSTLDLFQSITR